MKTVRLIGMALFAVLVSVSFTACNKDKDDNVKVPANAKGVWLWEWTDYSLDGWPTTYLHVDEVYLWINNYIVRKTDYVENAVITEPGEGILRTSPYYPFTIDRLYSLINEDYGWGIDDSNYQYYSPRIVGYAKEHLSSYKYIFYDDGDVYLFNRISDTNY